MPPTLEPRRRDEFAAGRDADAEYRIRRFGDGDRDAYLSLLERTRGDAPGTDWFEWKYRRNPSLDHVPVYLVERDGDLVGATGLWPIRLRVGAGSMLALTPCDAAFDSDRVRAECSADVVRTALGDYQSDRAAFCVGFWSAAADDESVDWTVVDRLATYYRVQDPAALVDLPDPLARPSRAVARGYVAACDRIAPSGPSLAVERYEDVPAALFADLYRSKVPDAVHARRDEEFYRWRFADPRRDYEAFVARRDGAPVAGAIASVRGDGRDAARTVRIVDVAPLLPADDGDRYASVLEAVVDAYADAALIDARPGAVPHDVLSRFGFHRDDAAPLSWVTRRTAVGVYRLADDCRSVNGHDLTDRRDWLLTFAEQDA